MFQSWHVFFHGLMFLLAFGEEKRIILMLGNTFRKYFWKSLSNNTEAETSTTYNSSKNNPRHLVGRIHSRETALEEHRSLPAKRAEPRMDQDYLFLRETAEDRLQGKEAFSVTESEPTTPCFCQSSALFHKDRALTEGNHLWHQLWMN